MRMSTDDLAWIKGEGSYVTGDTLEDGAKKAEGQGYKAGSQAYSAFLGGFSSMVRAEHGFDIKTAHKAV